MWIYRPIILAALAAASCGLMSATVCNIPVATSATVGQAYSGTFSTDCDEELFQFSLASTATVDLFTTSYASGGFWPVLTLYNNSTDAYIASDDGGIAPSGCGSRTIVSGGLDNNTCEDAFLAENNLAAGSYLLVLTEFNNLDSGNAAFAADGSNYSNIGQPDFTGGPFLNLNTFDQQTDAYCVVIGSGSCSSPTPEPVTGLMEMSGLAFTWVLVRRRRRRSS